MVYPRIFMQSDANDHEKVSKTKCTLIGPEPIGQFKCPRCDRVHAGLAEADVIAHVDEVNCHGASIISTDDYRRCFECGTLSSLFLKANPGDAPFLSTLQSVIAPKTKCMAEQPQSIEIHEMFDEFTCSPLLPCAGKEARASIQTSFLICSSFSSIPRQISQS
jgi:hypothetical protein